MVHRGLQSNPDRKRSAPWSRRASVERGIEPQTTTLAASPTWPTLPASMRVASRSIPSCRVRFDPNAPHPRFKRERGVRNDQDLEVAVYCGLAARRRIPALGRIFRLERPVPVPAEINHTIDSITRHPRLRAPSPQKSGLPKVLISWPKACARARSRRLWGTLRKRIDCLMSKPRQLPTSTKGKLSRRCSVRACLAV